MTAAALDGLTEAQRLAIDRRGESFALTATAGSGKTRVLVERFVRAVLDDGVAADRILAITFTEVAAHELRGRIRARFVELDERDAARDADAAFISTIHGFCTRLLRANPLAAGLAPDFAVLDEATAIELRRRAFDRALAIFLGGEDRAARLRLVAEFGIRRLEIAVRAVHDRLRSRGQRVPHLPPADADAPVAGLVAALEALLAAYGGAYAGLKRGRAAVDFDDLELEALELLRGDRDLRDSWAERFALLMVDEFQDTNPRQAELLSLLERDNLFVVGDPFQSIYGFRHADPRLFDARREALAATGAVGELSVNFRSDPRIVAAVNTAFAGRFGADFRPLVAAAESRLDDPAVELLVTDCAGRPAAAWRVEEARLLAERVAELLDAGTAPAGETVVLLRAGTDMATYDRAFAERGVRTLAAGGGYWSALEVLDLLGYLRALANPLDTVALYSLLGSPLVGASPDALALVGLAAQGGDVWQALREDDLDEASPDDRERVRAFAAAFAVERRLRARLPIDALLSRAIEANGYLDGLRRLPDGRRRVANVHKLLRIARAFERSEGRDLRRFIEHTDAVRVAVPREPEAPGEGGEAVRVMTIHGAKGLEADVVCVADLGRSRGNGEKPYLLCEDGQLGVCVPQPDGSFSAALDYVELRDRLRASETAEEDRILYVAMTRARKRLVLSGGVDLDRWPAETRSAAPISWLGPALVPDIDARLLAAPVSETDSGVRLVRNATTAVRDARPARTRVPTRAWAARGAAVQTGFPPRELSYSSLSDYSRCGYRYYLERVLRMPALPEGRAADGLSARDRGTLAHALLERLDFSVPRVPSVDDVARMLGLAPSPAEVEELRGLIAGFAASSLCERLAAAGGVRREEPFAFELDGILVNGYFDVIANEGGRALVVDYKSDRVGDADLEAITALEYEAQRRIYGLAALRCGVAGVDVVHCYLERVEEPVSASFDDAAPAEQELRELAARMSAASFPVASAPHREICSGCPGRARLCSWDEQITGRAAQDVMR